MQAIIQEEIQNTFYKTLLNMKLWERKKWSHLSDIEGLHQVRENLLRSRTVYGLARQMQNGKLKERYI